MADNRPRLIVFLLALVFLAIAGTLIWILAGTSHKDAECNLCSDRNSEGELLPFIVVNELFVGGGIGGLITAADRTRTLEMQSALSGKKFVLLEAQTTLGGNGKAIDLLEPEGYTGYYGKLRADLLKQRTNILSLTNQRRERARRNMTTYATPFTNVVDCGGRRVECTPASTQAFTTWPYYYSSGPHPEDPFSWGDFCTYGSAISNNTCGAFVGLRSETNLSDCRFIGHDVPGMCTVFPDDDPSYDTYVYLLQGNTAPPEDQADCLDCGDCPYTGCTDVLHPITKAACTLGVDCPIDICRANRMTWAELTAVAMSRTGGLTSNYNSTRFLRCDNVGFHDDYDNGYGCDSYGNYQTREWGNTASHSLYDNGTMVELVDLIQQELLDRGVEIALNETATCVSYSKRQGVKFEVRTPKRIFLVKEWLYLNTPPYWLRNSSVMTGPVIKDILSHREAWHPKIAKPVVTIVAQWEPGVPQWWWSSLFEYTTGNWSTRYYGDSTYVSRFEAIDSPLHRCLNALRFAYISSGNLFTEWQDYVQQLMQSGDQEPLKKRILRELRTMFPADAANITEPLLVAGYIAWSPWHWGDRQYDDLSNGAVSNWANAPLGEDVPLCVVAEAYHTYYSGWEEGAWRSSKGCLQRQNSTELQAIYDERDSFLPGDGSFASDFAYVPSAFAPVDQDPTKMLANEIWPPHNYPPFVDGMNYCNPETLV